MVAIAPSLDKCICSCLTKPRVTSSARDFPSLSLFLKKHETDWNQDNEPTAMWVIFRIFKMAAVFLRNLRNFFAADVTTKRTLVIIGRGTRSSIPCFAIVNRQFSDSAPTDVTNSPNELSPTVSRSPLFSGHKVAAKRFQLSFDEYQKLTRKLRTRQRLAGVPFGVTALIASSCASAYLFPNMFDATPEQIQPIL